MRSSLAFFLFLATILAIDVKPSINDDENSVQRENPTEDLIPDSELDSNSMNPSAIDGNVNSIDFLSDERSSEIYITNKSEMYDSEEDAIIKNEIDIDDYTAAQADMTEGSVGIHRQVGGWISSRKSKFVTSVQKLFANYNDLLKGHYLLVSFIQATVLGTLGDALAQAIEHWSSGFKVHPKIGRPYIGWLDVRRLADVGFLSMIIDGIFTPKWYELLEQVSEKKSFPVVIAKTLFSSLAYGPFANGLFLAGIPVLRYGKNAFIGGFNWMSWRRQLLIATIRDIQLISPLEFLNQLIVPPRLRPLVYEGYELLFHTILCLIANNDMALPAQWFFRAVDNAAGTNILDSILDWIMISPTSIERDTVADSLTAVPSGLN